MPLHGRRFAGGSASTSSPPPLGDGGSGSSGTGGTTLAAGATGSGSFTLNSKGIVINSIESSVASRVRFYGTAAARDADKNRKIGTPPRSNVNCEAEYLFSTSNQTIVNDPKTVVTNSDTPQSSLIYYNITNLSGGPATVTLTINYVSYL